MTVKLGIDVALDEGLLSGRRIGLLTNPSGVNGAGQQTRHLLWEMPDINLVAFFGPEHGIEAKIADGHKYASGADAQTGLPIYSLYGENLKPRPKMLEEIDLLVCDIQDVGVRFYTYIWTLYYVLEAAGEFGVPVMILDRPDPLGGERIEGPSLSPGYESFVGLFPIPARHGLTIGELATYLNQNHNPTPAQLDVIPCEGWQRSMWWDDTGLRWVQPSPNLPSFESVLVYPGTCLIEGTNLSEGRGASAPFQLVGAPWVDGEVLATALDNQQTPGAHFEATTFVPTKSKYTTQQCHGVCINVTNQEAFLPITMGVTLLTTLQQLCPDDFAWEYYREGGQYHIDRLTGSDICRTAIDQGKPLDDWVASWGLSCNSFKRRRAPILLY